MRRRLEYSRSSAGRSDDELRALLETSRVPGKWHNSMRDAIATMIGRGWSDSAIRLACAPYCRDGADDPDLDASDRRRSKEVEQARREG